VTPETHYSTGYRPHILSTTETTIQNFTMSFTGPTPTFAENDIFDGTNWASWQRLVHLAANQRGAMGYFVGFIKYPVRARNTSVPSKPSVAPAPVTITETP